MAAIVAKGLRRSYGDRDILRGVDLVVPEGARVGLVGPNGAGKTTLLRVLAGADRPDGGEILTSGSTSLLDQQPHLEGPLVDDAVGAAIRWHRELVGEWRTAVEAGALERAAVLHDRLDLEGWDHEHRVDAMLDRLGAPPRTAAVDRLSGGERRRVALARTLLSRPDVLLLDEPTNHLDADTIDWLQDLLAERQGTLVLVTHDRYLLEAVCDRIVEVDRGECVAYEGSWADYLIARAEREVALARGEDRRLKLLAREAEWACRSPAARTTKQRGRLQRLDALRAQGRLEVRADAPELDLSTGAKKGWTLIEARGLGKRRGGRLVVSGLDLELHAGDRVGLVGPNGIGKSTLLQLLAGELEPDAGAVRRGPRCAPAVLDQHRTGLDDEDTVFDAAGEGNDHVRLGDRHVHVASFLGRFQFGPRQLGQKVGSLSGGEKARLLLAKLLLRGANVLLLDEPTNDLDLATLQVLEEALLAFDGAAVIVAHDRAFVDRVCTGVLAFEGDGVVTAYASRTQAHAAREARATAAKAPSRTERQEPARPRERLGFREQRELEALPSRLEHLEQELAALEAVLASPATYRERSAEIPALTARLEALPVEIDALYARWAALEARA